MGLPRRLSVLFGAALACGVFAAGASAKIVTVGSPLSQQFEPEGCLETCTVISTGLEDNSALVSSPVTGAVVRWRILQASPSGQYRLRVVGRPGPLTFSSAGASAPATPSGSGLETFAAAVPIQAGQMIGLDLPPGASIGVFEDTTTSTFALFDPVLGDGETRTADFEILNAGEIAFNADIQPAPTVSGYSPSGGPINGGTPVTISGTDLTGATAVTFGGVPAVSYTVDSESQITAITPPLPSPGTYAVRVTTVAGSATAIAAFAALACTVPDVKGKSLKGAKKRLRKAGCGIGKLKKIKGATAKTGDVRRTNPKAGANIPPGAKVRIVLGP